MKFKFSQKGMDGRKETEEKQSIKKRNDIDKIE